MQTFRLNILTLLIFLLFFNKISLAKKEESEKRNLIPFESAFLNKAVDLKFHYQDVIDKMYRQSLQDYLKVYQGNNAIQTDSLFKTSATLGNMINTKKENYGLITTFFTDPRGIQLETYRIKLEKDLKSKDNIVGYSSNFIPIIDLMNTKEGYDSSIYNRFKSALTGVMRDTTINGGIKDRFNNLDLVASLNLYKEPKAQMTEIEYFLPDQCKSCSKMTRLIQNSTFFLDRVGNAYENKLSFKRSNQFNIDLNEYSDLADKYPHSLNLLKAIVALKHVLYQGTTNKDRGDSRLLDTLSRRLDILKNDYLNKEISEHELNLWKRQKASYYDCANKVYEFYLINGGACNDLLDSARRYEKSKNYFQAKAFYRAIKNKQCENKKEAVEGLKRIINIEMAERYTVSAKIDDYWYNGMTQAAYDLANRSNININKRFDTDTKLKYKARANNVTDLIKRTVVQANSDGGYNVKLELTESESTIEGELYIDGNSFIMGTQKIANYPLGEYKFPDVEVFFNLCAQLVQDISDLTGLTPNSSDFVIEVMGSSDGAPYYGKVRMPEGCSNNQNVNICVPKNMGESTINRLPEGSLGSNLKLATARGFYLKEYLSSKGIQTKDVILVNAFPEKSPDKRNSKMKFKIDLIK